MCPAVGVLPWGMATELILVRHAKTALNVQGMFQGHLDEPLGELGLAQARDAAPGLAALAADALYCSDLQRARQTAEAVAAASGLPLHTDDRLREIHCGTWQGRTVEEVAVEFPELIELRRSGADFRRSPTGETAAELADRVTAALEDIIRANKNQRVLVVAHGLAIRVGVARLLGLPDEFAMTIGTLKNCHYAVVSHSKRRVRLVSHNLPA